MSETVIQVQNLSKLYRIGPQQERNDTLRDTLTSAIQRMKPTRRRKISEASSLWALKDVSFTIQRGEAVGIIGRNGAGKSTLLKILSQITEPTSGRAVIDGRVGSLLEVGTGFHPELTGRENIYLYGAILGMHRNEINYRFDEIVAFAEIERFLDTPVKRYSSGMYVRLAFAVAAHLETELLLVDEVLAVGDAVFQKKCLGKMNSAADSGRTVVLVSHNMQAIQSLCSKAIVFDNGQISYIGPTAGAVKKYLSGIRQSGSSISWPEESAPGNQEFRLLKVDVKNLKQETLGTFSSKDELQVEFEFYTNTSHSALCVGFDLQSSDGITIYRSYQTDQAPTDWPLLRSGLNKWFCTIPRGQLNAGTYYISPRIGLHNLYWIINIEPVVSFEIILDHGISPFWNSLDRNSRPGVIAPILDWQARE